MKLENFDSIYAIKSVYFTSKTLFLILKSSKYDLLVFCYLPKLVSARAESKMAWLIFIFVSVGAPSSPKFGYWINPFLVLLSIPNQLEEIIFIWRMDYGKR